MAAQKDLEKMLERFRNPGMSPTAKGSIGTTDDGEDTADARNKRALEIMGVDSAFRRPGMAAGRSSVPTGSPAGRLAGDLNTMRSPAQMSRQSVERELNPAIGESARLAMIEQQRLRSNMRGPGKMNPVEFRAAMAQMGQNQQAVDSGLAAIGDIRDASVTERGQNLQATTALRDRQMAEAGDFDQALLGIDKAMLTGQYGLAAQEAKNNDPMTQALLGLGDQYLGDEPSKGDIAGLLNVYRGTGSVAPTGPRMATITTADGEFQIPEGLAIMDYYQRQGFEGDQLWAKMNAAGYGADPTSGAPTRMSPELRERQDAAAEQERRTQEALRAQREAERKALLEKLKGPNGNLYMYGPTAGGM